jgi:glucose-6-phosphate isomerase
MLTKNIDLKNFKKKKKNRNIEKIFSKIKKDFNSKSDLFLTSLSSKYQNTFNIDRLKRYKKFNHYTIIGMGGSSLGSKAIYSFFQEKIKKKFKFIDNLGIKNFQKIEKKNLNIVISKSGNTLETIVNFNSLKTHNNSIFISEKKENYLRQIASKLKKEIFRHQNFIGGRYSVLSETGMLPAFFMDLNIKNFKRLNYLIKDKKFENNLIYNVSSILELYNKKKSNSIILNYDENSNDLFLWYQQLVAESLGKNSKGILPVISTMPKDNHSLMQLYLDGKKNNFFTLFLVEEKSKNRLNKKNLSSEYSFLSNKTSFDVIKAQFLATQNVFNRKKIPFRSFIVNKRSEKVLGELFTYFMLETIMLGRALNINPFDQPEVELIKKETYKILKI